MAGNQSLTSSYTYMMWKIVIDYLFEHQDSNLS